MVTDWFALTYSWVLQTPALAHDLLDSNVCRLCLHLPFSVYLSLKHQNGYHCLAPMEALLFSMESRQTFLTGQIVVFWGLDASITEDVRRALIGVF